MRQVTLLYFFTIFLFIPTSCTNGINSKFVTAFFLSFYLCCQQMDTQKRIDKIGSKLFVWANGTKHMNFEGKRHQNRNKLLPSILVMMRIQTKLSTPNQLIVKWKSLKFISLPSSSLLLCVCELLSVTQLTPAYFHIMKVLAFGVSPSERWL